MNRHEPTHPMALGAADKANFQTLLDAASEQSLALVSAIRKSDGAEVALVCAMGRDGGYAITPLAVMIEGNPYELFEDPTR